MSVSYILVAQLVNFLNGQYRPFYKLEESSSFKKMLILKNLSALKIKKN